MQGAQPHLYLTLSQGRACVRDSVSTRALHQPRVWGWGCGTGVGHPILHALNPEWEQGLCVKCHT